MKIPTLVFCYVVFLLGCQSSTTHTPVPNTAETEPIPALRGEEQDSAVIARIKSAVLDSSSWDKKAMTDAFEKVRTFSGQEQARFKCDSFYFEKGNLVSSDRTHLMLYLRNREGYLGEYSVWEFKQGTFWHNMLTIQADIGTQGVLFKDMNGDGYKDFVREGYGTAGTGERYSNDVYLYNPRKQSFDYIDGLDLNPHFQPEKGIVTCYYMPNGVWSAQKYKLNWNVLEIQEEVEIELCEMIPGTEKFDCNRKIYRYKNKERYLYKEDKICDLSPEYKRYEALVKDAQ